MARGWGPELWIWIWFQYPNADTQAWIWLKLFEQRNAREYQGIHWLEWKIWRVRSSACCIIPSGPVLAQSYVNFFPLPGANFCVCPLMACLGFLSTKFLLPYTAAWLVIRTHVSRVAPWLGTFWRTLYQLSYRTSAKLFTFNWDPGGVLEACTGGFRPQGPGFISSYVEYFREIAIFKMFKVSKFRKKTRCLAVLSRTITGLNVISKVYWQTW